MARLRLADRRRQCLLIGADRKWAADRQSDAIDPFRTSADRMFERRFIFNLRLSGCSNVSLSDKSARQRLHGLNLFPASISSTIMGIGQNRANPGTRSFWRRLVGTALIYALIMQPLLLTIVGAQLANASAIDVTLSQICRHATDGSPLSPLDQHKFPAHHHCAFCFAAAFPLLDAPPAITIQNVRSETSKVRQSAHPPRLSWFSRYLVARPRGPPVNT